MPDSHAIESEDPVYDLPVATLAELCNPIECDPWGVGLTIDMIRKCMDDPHLLVVDPAGPDPRDPMIHAGRIAWLAIHGWHDPIEIDLGVPRMTGFLPNWIVTDGNHRLAAAILREDQMIRGTVCGSIDYAEELFGELKDTSPEMDFRY